MTLDTSRWTRPISPGAGQIRTLGWWGMVLGAVALLLFHSTLVAAYIYLRWGHDEWPPPGFEAPPLTPLLTVLGPLVAALLLSWARRRAYAGSVRTFAPALAGAALLGAGTALLRALDYADTPFSLDEHAYASLFWVLGSYEIVILVAGVVMALVVLVQALLRIVGSDHFAIAEVVVVYWWFAAVTSALSVGTMTLGARL